MYISLWGYGSLLWLSGIFAFQNASMKLQFLAWAKRTETKPKTEFFKKNKSGLVLRMGSIHIHIQTVFPSLMFKTMKLTKRSQIFASKLCKCIIIIKTKQQRQRQNVRLWNDFSLSILFSISLWWQRASRQRLLCLSSGVSLKSSLSCDNN